MNPPKLLGFGSYIYHQFSLHGDAHFFSSSISECSTRWECVFLWRFSSVYFYSRKMTIDALSITVLNDLHYQTQCHQILTLKDIYIHLSCISHGIYSLCWRFECTQILRNILSCKKVRVRTHNTVSLRNHHWSSLSSNVLTNPVSSFFVHVFQSLYNFFSSCNSTFTLRVWFYQLFMLLFIFQWYGQSYSSLLLFLLFTHSISPPSPPSHTFISLSNLFHSRTCLTLTFYLTLTLYITLTLVSHSHLCSYHITTI